MTNYFDKNVDNPDDKDAVKVLLTAPTGVAAFLIGGLTAHQAFKIPVNQTFDLSESLSNTILSQIRHVEIIVIDEISFLSNSNFHVINQRLQQIFGNHEPFGGKCVIVVGDLCQLPPVNGSPVYTSFVAKKGNKADIYDYLKDQFGWFSFKLYELKIVMRQKHPEFIRVLGNLSRLHMSEDDYNFLKTRHYNTYYDIPENERKGLTIIVYTNAKVEMWNNRAFDENKNPMFTSVAEDKPIFERGVDQGRGQEILDKFKSDEDNSINVSHTLRLKKGLRIMLIHNIDTGDGLVNGALGSIEEILTRPVTRNGKTIEEPYLLFVKFDLDVGKKRKARKDLPQKDGCVPITRDLIEIVKQHKTTKREIKPYRVLRKQFLIRLAAAITCHKAQGQTLPDGVAGDVSDLQRRLTIFFVLCSRTDFEKLYLFGTFGPPPKPKEEQQKKSETKKNEQKDEKKESSEENNEEEIVEEEDEETYPPAYKELERMRREAQFEIAHHILDPPEEYSQTIMYQNINGYNRKVKYIMADPYYEKADVLIFSEANVNVVTQFPSSFEVAFPRPEDKFVSHRNRGLVILAKPNTIQNLSKCDLKLYQNGHIDLRSFMVGNHFVITGYKSPNINAKTFNDELNSHMKKVC